MVVAAQHHVHTIAQQDLILHCVQRWVARGAALLVGPNGVVLEDDNKINLT